MGLQCDHLVMCREVCKEVSVVDDLTMVVMVVMVLK